MIQRCSQAVIVLLLVTGCSGMPANTVDPETVTELADCPSTPNCVVSTAADQSHRISPIEINGDTDTAWQTLQDILAADSSFEITGSADHYIRAEATTRLLRFTDDVEFMLDRDAKKIDMRSASRVGYSDLGKNRKRLEAIRSKMREAGAGT